MTRHGRKSAISSVGPPANYVLPTITGTTTDGQLLTGHNGSYSPLAASFTYRWQRSANGVTGWVDISGSVSATRLLTASDVNYYLRRGETPTGAEGIGLEVFTLATAQVAAAGVAVPVIVTPPSISGAAEIGATITITPAVWTGSPTTITYSLRLDGVEYATQSGLTFVVPGGSNGQTLTVRELATNAGGTAGSTSNAIGPILTISPYLVPGTVAFVSDGVNGNSNLPLLDWTTDPALPKQQGTAADFGYADRAYGWWMAGPIYDTIDDDTVDGDDVYITGVEAYKGPGLATVLAGNLTGIKEVWYRADGGPWLVVNYTIVHPVLGNTIWPCPIRRSDFPASRTNVQIDAVVVPVVGKPFILQGQPDARHISSPSTGGGTTNRLNSYSEMWSLMLNVDKGDLTKKIIYKGPPGDGGASDANDGSSKAQRVATWGRVRALALAWKGVGSPSTSVNFSGLTVRLTTGTAHDLPSFSTNDGLWGAKDRWVIIEADPADTAYSIEINGDYANATNRWIAERMMLRGLKKSVTWQPDLQTGADEYGAICQWRIRHEGAHTQNSLSQYDGASNSNNVDGHNVFIDVQVDYAAGAGAGRITQGLNCIFNHLGNQGDVFLEPKALSNCQVLNYGKRDTTGGDLSHPDVVQYRGSVRTGHLLSNFYTDSTLDPTINDNGGVFSDGACRMVDSAFMNVRSGSIVGAAFALNTEGQNVYVYNPDFFSGGVGLWDFDSTPSARNVRVVLTPTSNAGLLAETFRYGLSVISTTSTEEAVDPQLDTVSAWGDMLGAALQGGVDIAEPTYRSVDGTTLLINSLSSLVNHANSWAPPGTHTGQPKPLFVANAFGTTPAARFDGNATKIEADTLWSGSNAFTFFFNNPGELFFLGTQDIAGSVATLKGLMIWGSTNAVTGRIGSVKSTGTNTRTVGLNFPLSTGIVSVYTPQDYDVQGKFLLHAVKTTTGLVVNVYDSAHPNTPMTMGDNANFGGLAPTVPDTRAKIAGGSGNDTAGTHPAMDFSALLQTSPLTTVQRSNVLNRLRARAGWTTPI